MLIAGDILPGDWAKMDLSGSENSSDSLGSPGGSYAKLWATETSLMMGLKDASLAGLTDLVQDKDVAAKAVAFVVNSSRRGIVPLCSDVAAMLRNKLKLERTIEKQRKEIERLKSGGASQTSSLSRRTSRSTSPTHPLYEEQRIGLSSARLKMSATSPRLSSPSSPFSSPRSPSPPRPHSPEVSSASCGSLIDPPLPAPHPAATSPEGGECRQTSLLPNQRLVTAEVHRVPSDASLQGNSHSRRISPSPSDQHSVEIQCSRDNEEGEKSLQEQYQEACKARADLERELLKVKAELEQVKLGSRVKERSSGEGNVSGSCEVQIENETVTPLLKKGRSHSVQGVSDVPHPPPSPGSLDSQGLPAITSPRISPRNSDLSSSGRSDGSADRHLLAKNNHNLTVRLDDHVLIKGERMGLIKYIGLLDRSTSPNTLFVGLHLDTPVGKHDGMVHGRRYFWCPRHHGVFVPVNDVMAVLNRKPSKRPKTTDARRRSSSHGGGGIPAPHPSPSPHTSGLGGDTKRTRPGHAKRLISADATSLQTANKSREVHIP